MKKFVPILLVATALNVSVADAHHKPGHHMPPGQAKKLAPQAPGDLAPPVLIPTVVEDRNQAGWQRYFDEAYNFEVDLPLGLFEPGEESTRGVHFREVSGLAEIQVYGADNPRRLSPRTFVTALEDFDRIDEITYRAEGQSWFVLSGYYADDEGLGEPLIFYTKFMFSADLTRVSAFEMSYPASEKRRFDAIVEQIEESLTAPH